MSWEEIDKLIQDLFNTHLEVQLKTAENQQTDLTTPSEQFLNWLNKRIK